MFLSHIDITSSPQSVNTTLNGVAIFYCTYVGDSFQWKADGERIFKGKKGFKYNETELSQDLDLHMTTLSVVASQDRNNTNITCTAFALGSETVESEPALLLLQGKHQFCTS